MPTNITRKEQKDKWKNLHKEAFIESLLEERPRDYQERNWFYQLASIIVSYPLQLISILAGSYLLYDVFRYIWQLELYSLSGGAIFAACVFIFFSIETLRRWLVNGTGDYHVRSFKINNGRLKKGEWLKNNLYSLGFISLLLVSTGTIGVYQYIKNNSPERISINLERVSKPHLENIQTEQKQISRLDAQITELMQAKKRELADKRSYGNWQGKDYLLPEVKQRHNNYDKQINSMNTQRQKHLLRLEQQESKLNNTETETKDQNASIAALNTYNKELYASISASVWLGFELLLVFMLAYNWLFKYYTKREKLLELLSENPELKSHYQEFRTKANGQENIFRPHLNDSEKVFNEKAYQSTTVGFRLSEKDLNDNTAVNPSQAEVEPEIITKEAPAIKEVEEVKKEVNPKPKSKEGFMITCQYCGTTAFKKRPAKYCSATCRNKAWKEAKAKTKT